MQVCERGEAQSAESTQCKSTKAPIDIKLKYLESSAMLDNLACRLIDIMHSVVCNFFAYKQRV